MQTQDGYDWPTPHQVVPSYFPDVGGGVTAIVTGDVIHLFGGHQECPSVWCIETGCMRDVPCERCGQHQHGLPALAYHPV
jgi:hypothetical protein